jgi:hypothetical protein
MAQVNLPVLPQDDEYEAMATPGGKGGESGAFGDIVTRRPAFAQPQAGGYAQPAYDPVKTAREYEGTQRLQRGAEGISGLTGGIVPPERVRQTMAFVGPAAEAGTAGVFGYLPALGAKGLGYAGVPGYEQYRDMPITDIKQKATDIVSSAREEFPKTGLAGTATGIVGGAYALPPVFPKARPVVSGATTGAVYGGIEGAAEKLDPADAIRGAMVGAGFGAALTPVLSRVAGGFQNMLAKRQQVIDPETGAFVPRVQAYLKANGLSDSDIEALRPHIAKTFSEFGQSPEAINIARFREFGTTPTKGIVTGEPKQLAAEAEYGAPSFERMRQEMTEGAQRIYPTPAPSPAEAVDIAARSAVRKGQAAENIAGKAYEAAREASPAGAFKAEGIQNLGTRITEDWATKPDMFGLVQSPVTERAVKYLDDMLGKAIPAPQGTFTMHRDMGAVEEARKGLNLLLRGAQTPQDKAAMRNFIDAFDDKIERAINDGAFVGDPKAGALYKEARQKWQDYQRKFGVRKSGEDVGSLFKEIRDGTRSPEDVANMIFNFQASGDAKLAGTAMKTLNQFKRAVGPGAPELEIIKRSFVQNLVTPRALGPQEAAGPRQFAEMAKRVDDFLDGKGRMVAKQLLDDSDRELLRRFSGVMKMAASPSQKIDAGKVRNLVTLAGESAGAVAPFVMNAFVSMPFSTLAQAAGLGAGALAAKRGYEMLPAVRSRMAQKPFRTPAREPRAATAVPLGLPYAGPESEFPESRVGRASGGRVDAQFHAEKLIKAAEQAKKAASAMTEPLLEQPDEHIVKALDIAKRHI